MGTGPAVPYRAPSQVKVSVRQMKHLKSFEEALNNIRGEGRYRVFIDLQRHKGRFPKATARMEDGEREVTIWCSNDYLGMGQDQDVIDAMHEAIDSFGAGSGEIGRA